MRIGIDLGGTKIEAIALSPGGEEIARRRVATPREYMASLEAIAALVRELERDSDEATVGVGIPGTLAPRTGLVKNANSTWLNGRPLGRDLERRLGRPVRLMNDANCFALSEATDGAETSLPASGGTIPCRGPRPASSPVRRATAASAAVSKPGSPGRGSSATTPSIRVLPCPAGRSCVPRRVATPAQRRLCPDTTIDSAVRSRR